MQAVDPDVKAADAQIDRSVVQSLSLRGELLPSYVGTDQTSEPELQAVDPDVKAEDAQTERSAVELSRACVGCCCLVR